MACPREVKPIPPNAGSPSFAHRDDPASMRSIHFQCFGMLKVYQNRVSQVTCYQNVMRALHQQFSHIRIAFLGNPQLRPAIARLSPTGPQPKVGAGISAAAESIRVVHREHIGQRGECAHSMHLLQRLGLRISTVAYALDLLVVFPDAFAD